MLALLSFIIIALRPNATTRSLGRGNRPVPSRWQATAVDHHRQAPSGGLQADIRAIALLDAHGEQITINLHLWRQERRLRALLGAFAAAPQVHRSDTAAGLDSSPRAGRSSKT